MTSDIGTICAMHLQAEEYLLIQAIPRVRQLQAALASNPMTALPDVVTRHQELSRVIDLMNVQRQQLVKSLGGTSTCPREVRLSQIVEAVPGEARAVLRKQLMRVRALAEELLTLNHRVSVHVRIHADAYQRLLRDLTGTAGGSGRYGAGGQTEAAEYRALLQVNG